MRPVPAGPRAPWAGLACRGGRRGRSQACPGRGAGAPQRGAGSWRRLTDLPGNGASQQPRRAAGPPCLFLAGRGDSNIYLSCGVWHQPHQAPSGRPSSESRAPSALRGAGVGGAAGFLPGQSLGVRAPGQARLGRSSRVGMWLPPCQASPAGPDPGLVLVRSTPTSQAVSSRIYCALHVAHCFHPRPGVSWARRCGPSQGRGG